MADNILRLKVESSEYDAKLKKAAEGIRHLAEVAHRGGGELTGLEKAELDYVKGLGSMETKSRTASGSVRELESTFKELTVVYNHLNDVEKQDEGGKALRASLDQIKQRAQEARAELDEASKSLQGAGSSIKGVSDGNSGLTSMLAVFGGNLLTKGVSMLTSELVGSVQQSIELAQQGEGIRMAFERLNQPGLLDNLKAATHGTVSEIELMKQAIKFENFKLPVEDLANYLAFAQQKAKDTGESIDFLVTSIVNGLGRQSKQILDNLGISAAELTQRMNEGATMTEAVSAIIKEEMAKAGDYVETAAERAARATADTENKMEELGRSAMPVAEEFASAWAEIRNGAMTLVLPVLSSVADSIRDIREILGGEWDMPKLKPGIPNLAEGPAESNQPKRPTWGDVPVVKAPGGYVEVTDSSGKVLHGGHYDSEAQLQNMMKRWNTLTTPTRTPGSRSTAKKEQTELQQNQTEIAKLTQEYVRLGDSETEASRQRQAEIQKEIQLLEKRNGQLKLYEEQAHGRLLGNTTDITNAQDLSRTGGLTGFVGIGKSMMPIEGLPSMSDVVRQRGGNLLDDKAMKAVKDGIYGDTGKKGEKNSAKSLLNGISQLTDGLQKIGIDIPEEVQAVIGVVQGVMQVIEAVNTIIGVTQTTALTANTAALISLEAAIWANTASSIIPFANGGVVRAAGGTVVGNTYSGDQIPALLNAGEVVLNRSQVSTLASQLQGGGAQNMKLEATVSGEQLRFVLNNNGRRTGRGEYVQSTKRS